MMNFEELLYHAKCKDKEAIQTILELYRPLLMKHSIVLGNYDEDLYQELVVELLKCIHYFSVE